MPSPPFDPLQYQPLMFFFDIECGDVKKIYTKSAERDGPKFPIGIRITHSTAKAFTVVLDFFDASGHVIERAFAKNSKFRFKFGWKGKDPYESKWYDVFNARIQSFGLSQHIQVTGTFVGEFQSMTSINPMSGTIKEMIDEIGKLHNLKVTYNPEFSTDHMSDSGYNNDGDTEIIEKMHMKYANETDKNFVNRILKYARDDKGRGGYFAVWGQDRDSSDQTLNICLPEESTQALKYEFPCTDVMNVIDWRPVANIVMGSISGGTGTQINGYEQSTGNMFKTSLDPSLTKDYQNTLGNPVSRPVVQNPDPGAPKDAFQKCSETMDESVVTNSMRAYSAGTTSSMARSNIHLNYQLDAAAFNNEATLILIGDPGIDETFIGKTLEMKAFYQKTYDEESVREPHWSTGKWNINGYEHVGTAGGFQTTLFLNRIGSEDMLIGQKVEDDGASGVDDAQTEVGGVVING